MRRVLLFSLAVLVFAAPAAARPKKHVKHSGTLVASSKSSVTVEHGDQTVTCARGTASPKVRAHVGHKVKIACKNGVLVAMQQVLSGSATGAISGLSASSITVHTDGGDVNCAITDGAPKLGDYHVGDRVKIACTNGVLTAIGKLDTPPSDVQTRIGTLTALSDTSLTVHDDDGDLTCKLTDGSPKISDFHVGDRVKIACASGVLKAIAKVDVTSITVGTLTALSPTSITVNSDGGDRTCSRGTASPSLDGFAVGDKVKMTCVNGVLTAIARPDTYTGGLGPITALSDTSLTIHTDGGDVTCKLTADSPKLGDFHVGDTVKMYCKNGVLFSIAKPDTYQTGAGSITTLSDSVLTVHTESGDLTCKLTDGSPMLTEFHLGDKVKIGCTNGVLTAIARADVYTGGIGPITALSDASLTIHTDGGDVTCKLTADSPKLDDYHIGDTAKIYCRNGVLFWIAKSDGAGALTVSGTLSALSPTSLTVHSGGGDLTCSRNGSSPSLDGYQVGNSVKATCTNGALTAIAHF